MIDERVLGVVGGIGPESSLDYYRRLVDGWHGLVGGAGTGPGQAPGPSRRAAGSTARG